MSRKEKYKFANINLWLKFHKGKWRCGIMKPRVVVDNGMVCQRKCNKSCYLVHFHLCCLKC